MDIDYANLIIPHSFTLGAYAVAAILVGLALAGLIDVRPTKKN